MANAIISVNSEASEQLIKEAKKKCIDEDLSFSDAVLLLLDLWVKDKVKIQKKEVAK